MGPENTSASGTSRYDLLVIGGGSGGVRAARFAAQRGLRVAVVEGARYGGTCVNVGCVPKKLFFHAAHAGEVMRDAGGFGWQLEGSPRHHWPTLRERIAAYLARLNRIYERMLDDAGVTRIEGWARFLDEHRVAIEVERGDALEHLEVRADHILVATGGRPRALELEGGELAKSSDGFFALADRPRSALVLGGGYIGVELASVLHGLEVPTTLAYRGELPLSRFDEDLRRRLDEALRAALPVRARVSPSRLERTERGLIRVHFDDGGPPCEVELVLAAIGRRPNVERLNLSAAGIAQRAGSSAIEVDERYRTSRSHIFAVGDVIDRVQLTPVALAEAMRVVSQLVGEEPERLDYDLVPTTVFTHPNVGTVGLSEGEARARGIDVAIFETEFRPLHQALSSNPRRVYMKLVVCRETDRVLGFHILGDEAGEQLQGLAAAMQAAVTKRQLDRTIGIHPTMAEEWVTMRSPRA